MSVNSYSFHFQPVIHVESYVNIFIGGEYECEKILLTKLNLKKLILCQIKSMGIYRKQRSSFELAGDWFLVRIFCRSYLN